jgi:hypothetical protein
MISCFFYKIMLVEYGKLFTHNIFSIYDYLILYSKNLTYYLTLLRR